jgi:hypothetical protein
MLDQLRIRAFAKFISEFGEKKLLDALEKNESDGIKYHYNGKLSGDYDRLQSEEEIIQLLLRGL